MKLIKRKSKENTGIPEANTKSLSTVFPSFSSRPLPYEHSRKFILDGTNPVETERQRLKNRSVDWLIADMRDASFEADSRDEISYGKRQFTNHSYCISAIIAENEGEIQVAPEQEKLILAELEYYDFLEAKLHNKEC